VLLRVRPSLVPPLSPRRRYALVSEKRALTKFLKCVDWSDAQEAQQVRGGGGAVAAWRSMGAAAPGARNLPGVGSRAVFGPV
jgi:hypothetical protein